MFVANALVVAREVSVEKITTIACSEMTMLLCYGVMTVVGYEVISIVTSMSTLSAALAAPD